MAVIDWTAIIVPEPVVYDDKYQTRNQELFYSTLLRILKQMKTLSFQITDVTNVTINAGTLDLGGVEQAIKDLAFERISVDLGALTIDVHGGQVGVEL